MCQRRNEWQIAAQLQEREPKSSLHPRVRLAWGSLEEGLFPQPHEEKTHHYSAMYPVLIWRRLPEGRGTYLARLAVNSVAARCPPSRLSFISSPETVPE